MLEIDPFNTKAVKHQESIYNRLGDNAEIKIRWWTAYHNYTKDCNLFDGIDTTERSMYISGLNILIKDTLTEVKIQKNNLVTLIKGLFPNNERTENFLKLITVLVKDYD